MEEPHATTAVKGGHQRKLTYRFGSWRRLGLGKFGPKNIRGEGRGQREGSADIKEGRVQGLCRGLFTNKHEIAVQGLIPAFSLVTTRYSPATTAQPLTPQIMLIENPQMRASSLSWHSGPKQCNCAVQLDSHDSAEPILCGHLFKR